MQEILGIDVFIIFWAFVAALAAMAVWSKSVILYLCSFATFVFVLWNVVFEGYLHFWVGLVNKLTLAMM